MGKVSPVSTLLRSTGSKCLTKVRLAPVTVRYKYAVRGPWFNYVIAILRLHFKVDNSKTHVCSGTALWLRCREAGWWTTTGPGSPSDKMWVPITVFQLNWDKDGLQTFNTFCLIKYVHNWTQTPKKFIWDLKFDLVLYVMVIISEIPTNLCWKWCWSSGPFVWRRVAFHLIQ